VPCITDDLDTLVSLLPTIQEGYPAARGGGRIEVVDRRIDGVTVIRAQLLAVTPPSPPAKRGLFSRLFG
jgi:hypothetical protein